MPNYKKKIRRAARKYGVRPELLLAQLNQESGLRMGLKSPAGAEDIAQFMPGTARQYGVTLGDGKAGDDIRGAAHLMHDLLKQFGGDERKALAAYNAGPGAVQKYGGVPPYAETQAYVKKILGAAGRRGSMPTPSTSRGSAPRYTTTTQTTPGVDNSGLRQQAKLAYLDQRGNPDALLELATTLRDAQDIPGSTVTRTRKVADPSAPTGGHDKVAEITGLKGVAEFDGAKVAAWIAPVLEFARKQGWKGTVNSGYRSDKEQQRIYDSGVRPAAKPRAYGGGGSNHEFKAFPGGAVDVSDAETLAQILKHSKYHKFLQWAGAKDPVHFSHPHNGSY